VRVRVGAVEEAGAGERMEVVERREERAEWDAAAEEAAEAGAEEGGAEAGVGTEEVRKELEAAGAQAEAEGGAEGDAGDAVGAEHTGGRAVLRRGGVVGRALGDAGAEWLQGPPGAPAAAAADAQALLAAWRSAGALPVQSPAPPPPRRCGLTARRLRAQLDIRAQVFEGAERDECETRVALALHPHVGTPRPSAPAPRTTPRRPPNDSARRRAPPPARPGSRGAPTPQRLSASAAERVSG
jgi:hypothetical protein